MNINSVDIIIPTYRPDADFWELLRKLKVQSLRPQRIIIMNTDEAEWDKCGGSRLVREAADGLCEIHHISKEEFDHGHTRNIGVSYSHADYFICMTQDAVPADDRLVEKMMDSFDDPVKMCYARQLARDNSNEIEKITRKFNYPEESVTKNSDDTERLGIKTFFASNVCCAYERKTFDMLGGFIDKTDFNEDMMYAAELVRAGYSIRYCADAKVWHSHNYSPVQQFKRNYCLAISQSMHPEYFGNLKSESEGIKLVKVSAKELTGKGKWYLIPELVFTSGVKYLGYRAGRIAGKKK
ncbi:MAG: glycosyltransferase [Lachnospiraceae bacterium]|nr:glycosyltransferase [Candidatus Darwinimomas equi]